MIVEQTTLNNNIADESIIIIYTKHRQFNMMELRTT